MPECGEVGQVDHLVLVEVQGPAGAGWLRQAEAGQEGGYVQKVCIAVAVGIAGGEGVLDDVDGYAVVEGKAGCE